MSLKSLMSFSTGELTPSLHDNVTLSKFQKGLETARNIMISKTGSILSRFSRANFAKSKNDDESIVCFSSPTSGILTEWGNQYVRTYDFDGNLLDDTISASLPVEADLKNLHFIPSGDSIYVFLEGSPLTKYTYTFLAGVSVQFTGLFTIPSAPFTSGSTVTGPPTGYDVEYAVTNTKNGEETDFYIIPTTFKVPLSPGHSNELHIETLGTITGAGVIAPERINIYRRPLAGGSFGFLGSTSEITLGTVTFGPTTGYTGNFVDLGSAADFTNSPPELITQLGFDSSAMEDLYPKTGAVYQQRLLLGNFPTDNEAMLASRPGHQNNFFRDFPYDADSALKFKSGTSGSARVLRMVDNEGLIVFTTIGVYVSVGLLSIDNLAFEKRGSWIIKEDVPPLAIPGGVFFIDAKTNSIRQLVYSRDSSTYETIDQTIFSDHLFKHRTITSWGFQEGANPLIVVCFSDGDFATCTYHHEHQMRAWTRHDSVWPVEQVIETGVADSLFFVINKNGNRYIEVSLPRIIPADVFVANPEADKINLNALMDGIKTTSTLVSDSLVGTDVLTLTPTVPSVWDDPLTLTCGTSALFPSPGLGDVGTIFRHFDINDKTSVDLEVTARTDDNTVTVLPAAEFPSDQASGFRLYETFLQVTSGIDHLEGENVSVMVDGFIDNSPNNDVDGYDPIIVTGGILTLAERAAICIVGRPITADIGTLNINTVSQAPTTVESLTVDKLYIRVLETRGLYVANKFPEGDSIADMENLDIYDVENDDILGNRYKQPVSKRIEATLRGEWDSNGKIAIRQVDPLHFEILSIIPDVEVLNRDNRS